MFNPRAWGLQGWAAWALVVGTGVQFLGLMMFWLREGYKGHPPPTPAYLLWERGFILAAIIVTAIGFVLLDGALQQVGERPLARVGAVAFLFGGVLGVAAEVLGPTLGYDKVYPAIVVYVVLAFLAQAAIGAALLPSGSVPAWVGWTSIVWNIGWLTVLPLISPRDIYFPTLHQVAPLLIGVSLLWRAA